MIYFEMQLKIFILLDLDRVHYRSSCGFVSVLGRVVARRAFDTSRKRRAGYNLAIFLRRLRSRYAFKIVLI